VECMGGRQRTTLFMEKGRKEKEEEAKAKSKGYKKKGKKK